MKAGLRNLHSLRSCENGAAAVEFAIISTVLILVCLGTIEFGRALNTRNALSFAADFGAREILRNSDVAESDLKAEIRDAFAGAYPELLSIQLGTETVDGVEFRTLSLSYPFTLLVPNLSNQEIGLSVDRRTPVT